MLDTNDDVVAKINVQYSSYIVTYETDSNGYDVAKLGSKPKKVTTLSVTKTANSSIDVEWTAPSNEPNLRYELVWNNGVGEGDNAQYVPLTQPYTHALKYNRGNLRPGKTYMFKVRAINNCGSSEFSNAQTLAINTVPRKPTPAPVIS
jgi:predicted phage tail protein